MGLWAWFTGLFAEQEPTAQEKLQQSVEQVASGNNKIQAKVGELISKREEIEEQLPEADRELAKWNLICRTAAGIGKEDQVRLAVKTKLEAQARRDKLKATYDQLGLTVEKLQGLVSENDEKIDEAKIAQMMLDARMESAKVRQEMAGDVMGKGPFSALEEMEDETVKAESTAQAYEETSTVKKKGSISDLAVEEEVARLLQRKG